MDAERWSRVTALFDQARELPAGARVEWLLRECADEQLRAEVLDLLATYDSDPGFLESPVDAGAVAAVVQDRAPGSLANRRLGAYRLVREIGRGGMGVVYEAARDDAEFERRVAIKLLPSGWSSPALAERFRFERRVLAGLDHPNIARLIDAGTTDDGVPYFVMELVDGQPIDAWCRESRLAIRERDALVCAVCDAVDHAHQHLVIHRDIKPGNVFVTADGQPKLLDFGIATLVSEAEGVSLGATRTGQHGFTVEYASPEQLRGERVTTATDVYSLGVLLYRLVAGQPPYDLSGLTTLEAVRVAIETDPRPPSRVAQGGDGSVVRGDLDNIVLKALRKDSRERYLSVNDLAADLRAWVEGRAVAATPPTLAYRTRKYVARHKLGAGAAAALTISLLAGGAATAWQAHRAGLERDKAQRRFAQVREFSRSLLFDVHSALQSVPGATEPRRLLLDRAVRFLDGLAVDAGDDAGLKIELAEGYRRLGHVQGGSTSDNVGDRRGARRSFEAAARLADVALALAPRSVAALDAVAGAYDDLSTLCVQVDDDAAADRAYGRHREAVQTLERDHAGKPGVARAIASSYLNLGYFRGIRGDMPGAKSLYEKAVQTYRALPPAEQALDDVARGHARALQRLGAILLSEGRLAESEERYRAAIALDDAVLARNPANALSGYDMTFSLTDLGLIARKRGDLAAAEASYRRALGIREAALAADPNSVRIMQGVSSAHGYLSGVYYDLGKRAEAIAHRRAALRLQDQLRAVLGDTTRLLSDQAWGQLYLAGLLLDEAEAEPSERTAMNLEARQLLDKAAAGARESSRGRPMHPSFAKLLEEQQARLRRPAQ